MSINTTEALVAFGTLYEVPSATLDAAIAVLRNPGDWIEEHETFVSYTVDGHPCGCAIGKLFCDGVTEDDISDSFWGALENYYEGWYDGDALRPYDDMTPSYKDARHTFEETADWIEGLRIAARQHEGRMSLTSHIGIGMR